MARHSDQRRTVLLVDDDVDLRRFLVEVLEERGFLALQASGVADGLAHALHTPCDVAAIDWVLEDGSGMRLVEELRQRSPSTRLVLMTAHTWARSARERLAADPRVAAMLQKPLSAEGFVASVEDALQTRPASLPAAPSLSAQLEVLRLGYSQRLPDRARELKDALEVARSTDDLDAARRLAHRLHGTAGTYGFGEVGRAAGAIERRLEALADAGEAQARMEIWGQIDSAWQELHRSLPSGAIR